MVSRLKQRVENGFRQESDPSPPRPAVRGGPSALRSPLSPAEREMFFWCACAPRERNLFSFSAGEKVYRDRRSHQPSRAG